MITDTLSIAISDAPKVILPKSVESKGYKISRNGILFDRPAWFSDLPVFLIGPVFPGWKLIQPLPINVEQEDDGTYIISDDIFMVYGIGDAQTEAIRDYVSSLIVLYQLIEDGLETNPFDQIRLIALQSYLQHG